MARTKENARKTNSQPPASSKKRKEPPAARKYPTRSSRQREPTRGGSATVGDDILITGRTSKVIHANTAGEAVNNNTNQKAPSVKKVVHNSTEVGETLNAKEKSKGSDPVSSENEDGVSGSSSGNQGSGESEIGKERENRSKNVEDDDQDVTGTEIEDDSGSGDSVDSSDEEEEEDLGSQDDEESENSGQEDEELEMNGGNGSYPESPTGIPLSGNFLTKSALCLYEKVYAGKVVNSGRYLCMNLLKGSSVQAILKKMCWDKIVEVYEDCYPELVRMFFANMSWSREEDGSPVVDSYVLHKSIRLTVSQVNEFLGTKDEGLCYFSMSEKPDFEFFADDAVCDVLWDGENLLNSKTGGKCYNTMSLENRLLHRLLNEIVLCRSQLNHSTDTSYMSLFLTFMGCKKKLVNVGHMVLENMIDAHSSKKGVLPYGMILTKIFKKLGLDLDTVDVKLKKEKFELNMATLKKMGFYRWSSGQWHSQAEKYRGKRVRESNTESRIVNMDSRLIAVEVDVKTVLKNQARITKYLKRLVSDVESSSSSDTE